MRGTRLTDGKRTVEIVMNLWTGSQYTPDFSADFFEAGALDYDEEKEAYVVEDVDYCIEQAEDWENSRGDYAEDEDCPSASALNGWERCVDVTEV